MFKKLIWFVLSVFCLFQVMVPLYIYAKTDWFFSQSNQYSPNVPQVVSPNWKLSNSYRNERLLTAIERFSNWILWLAALVVMIRGIRKMDFVYIIKYTLVISIIWLVESIIFYTIKLSNK